MAHDRRDLNLRRLLVALISLGSLAGCSGVASVVPPPGTDLSDRDWPTATEDSFIWPAPPVVEAVIDLPSDVLFEIDSDELTAEARAPLTEAAAALMAMSDVSIVVNGHTDTTGSASHNLELSRRRAEAVRRFLVQAGVPENSVRIAAWGESNPIHDPELTDADRATNRRVSLDVLAAG